MNLLVNALDAVRARDPATSCIKVRAFTDATGRAIVEVQDNGHGIPSDVLPRIFDPFFTTKAPRSGSGLGLAICQRIVGDLGGRVEAILAPGARRQRRALPRDAPADHRRGGARGDAGAAARVAPDEATAPARRRRRAAARALARLHAPRRSRRRHRHERRGRDEAHRVRRRLRRHPVRPHDGGARRRRRLRAAPRRATGDGEADRLHDGRRVQRSRAAVPRRGREHLPRQAVHGRGRRAAIQAAANGAAAQSD